MPNPVYAMSVPTPCAINNLPPEILSVIVEDTCAGDASEIILPVPQYELPCPILCLSQVNRLWRNISHGRKNLWTHYIIDIDPYATPEKLSDLLALLSICIQHSGTRELLFQFTDNNDVGGDVLVELLTAYSHRITTLSLTLDAHGATTLLNRPTLPFDRLRTLFVLEKPLFRAAGTLWDGADPDTVSAFFADAPQLTDFRVEDSIWHPLNSPGLVLHTWGIPLARLTVIHVTHVWLASDECVVIFRGCPQVVDCSLFCDEHGPVESLLGPNPPPPVLFALKKLSLTFRVLHGGLWEYFAAPELEDLTITSLSDDDERAWDNDEFTSFRARSAFFVLTTLRLQFDFTDDVDTMIELLRSLCALDGLVLRWTTPRQEASSDVKRLLHNLAFHPCHSLTLPKLRHIGVDATADSLNMLRSRCPPKTGLAGVTLYERSPFDSETVFREEIEGLRRNGVRVEVEPMDFYGAHDVP